jgi:hypothetical protein
MLNFLNKGCIRGKGSNFRIPKILICIAIPNLKLDEESMVMVPELQNAYFWGQRSNFRISKILTCT